MMNLSLCIFGATYITRDKLPPMVGSTHSKPTQVVLTHVDHPKILQKINKILKNRQNS